MSVTYLESGEGKAELQWLRSTMKKSYGPLGDSMMFQLSLGGRVTITSHSQRLLPMLAPSTPVGRLLVNALHSHAQHYRDSGLYAGLLATEVILRGLELPFSRHQVAMVTSHALSLITGCLSENLACGDVGKSHLDLSSRSQMTSLLRCLLCSKTTVTQLTNSEIDHLASLLLQSFLTVTSKKCAVPFAANERVHIHTCLGRHVAQSRLLTGLLIECPDSGGKEEVVVEKLSCDGDNIVTALFDVSLAGDLPDEFPREVQLVTEDPSVIEGGREMERVAVRRLMRVASHLVEMGVRFVSCQKVIHPLLKDYWREKGVVTVDRLSAANLTPVKDLTGGQIISSLTTGLFPSCLGRLSAVHYTSVLGKRYMVLEGSSGGYCSLMLCCQTDYVADELRPLCSSALFILQQCLQAPYVLHGGGCTETQLSHFLLTKASNECSTELWKDLQCNEKTFKSVMKSVASSFQAVAVSLEHHRGTVLSDSFSHHCWFFPPEDYMTQLVGDRGNGAGDESREAYCPNIRTRNRYSSRDILPGVGDRKREQQGLECCVDEDNVQGAESYFPFGKTCGCGCVRVLDLPSTCEWIPLGDDKCSIYVQDVIKQCLKRRCTKLQHTASSDVIKTQPFPCVCDAFFPKVKAIETANDLASTVLRIAFSISEK